MWRWILWGRDARWEWRPPHTNISAAARWQVKCSGQSLRRSWGGGTTVVYIWPSQLEPVLSSLASASPLTQFLPSQTNARSLHSSPTPSPASHHPSPCNHNLRGPAPALLRWSLCFENSVAVDGMIRFRATGLDLLLISAMSVGPLHVAVGEEVG